MWLASRDSDKFWCSIIIKFKWLSEFQRAILARSTEKLWFRGKAKGRAWAGQGLA